ncbi:unnamed protein product, partial [Effrenium voratum]
MDTSCRSSPASSPKPRRPPRPPSAKSRQGSTASSCASTPRCEPESSSLRPQNAKLTVVSCSASVPPGEWANGIIEVPLRRATCQVLVQLTA